MGEEEYYEDEGEECVGGPGVSGVDSLQEQVGSAPWGGVGFAIFAPEVPDRTTLTAHVFVDHKRYSAEFLMLGPKWHDVLEDGAKWEENGIEHDILGEKTFPYPGTKVFSQGVIGTETATIENGKFKKTERNLNDWPVNRGE